MRRPTSTSATSPAASACRCSAVTARWATRSPSACAGWRCSPRAATPPAGPDDRPGGGRGVFDQWRIGGRLPPGQAPGTARCADPVGGSNDDETTPLAAAAGHRGTGRPGGARHGLRADGEGDRTRGPRGPARSADPEPAAGAAAATGKPEPDPDPAGRGPGGAGAQAGPVQADPGQPG